MFTSRTSPELGLAGRVRICQGGRAGGVRREGQRGGARGGREPHGAGELGASSSGIVSNFLGA